MPKLAIAIPIYNGAATLARTMENLLSQDFQDFEIFIIENCSTDNSLEIAQEYANRDKRISVVACKEHLNMLDNFVRAINFVQDKGQYFCLRACDDTASADYFGKLITALDANPDKLMAGGDACRITGDQTKTVRPNDIIFDFPQKVVDGRIPRNLQFPSEWFYGVFRGAQAGKILTDRWPELGNPWAAASYAVAEFVILGKAEYVPNAQYEIYVGSDSVNLYFKTRYIEKLKVRWAYAKGCYRLHRKLPPMGLWVRSKFFRMCWNDSRRKTAYSLFGFQKRPEIKYETKPSGV